MNNSSLSVTIHDVTISWQFVTIFHFGKLVANLYDLICEILSNPLVPHLQ